MILIGGTVIAATSGLLGYSLRGEDLQVVERPVPGPTETVVSTKKVRVENPLEFSLVPLRTPLSLPAPRKGIPRRKSLVPGRAHVEQFERVPAAAGIPPQIVIAWRKGERDFPEALGLLLWQFDESGRKPRWRVIFGIHEAELGCHEIRSSSDRYFSKRRLHFSCLEHDGVFVGPPLKETQENLLCHSIGPSLGFSLHDLTGDGHKDVFVSEGGCGSGGWTVWRVLMSSASGTEQVFRHAAGDTGMRIVAGTIRVRAAAYRKNDSHCCPSFFRKYTLIWNGTEFVRTDSRLMKARY